MQCVLICKEKNVWNFPFSCCWAVAIIYCTRKSLFCPNKSLGKEKCRNFLFLNFLSDSEGTPPTFVYKLNEVAGWLTRSPSIPTMQINKSHETTFRDFHESWLGSCNTLRTVVVHQQLI